MRVTIDRSVLANTFIGRQQLGDGRVFFLASIGWLLEGVGMRE